MKGWRVYTYVMRHNVIGILLGFCIVTFLWVSGYGAAIIEPLTSTGGFDAQIAKVLNCAKKPDSVTCVRPIVLKMLEEKSGAEIVEVLSARLPPLQCHYVGHVVGQQLHKQYPDVEEALAKCDRSCDSACIHGVIGQAFATALGYPDVEDEDFDLKHLSPVDISKIGKQLCDSAGACHGVGHVLFQAYKKFEPAFSMCREIGGASITTCYNGVTMEYADVLSSRNMRAVRGVEYPDKEQFASLCLFPRIEETRACFRYFPRIMEETLERDGVSQKEAQQRQQEICESYVSIDHRIACFAGIGTHRAYTVLTDTAAAVQKCEGFSKPLDQAACILGIVTVATGDRQRQLASFCAAQGIPAMQAVCYQGLFFTLYSGGARLDVPLLCGTDNVVCEENAKKYKIDSWQYIQKNFGG